ncbi:peptidase M24, structural domain-containing protein [Dipodascopsis uninucleata]
MVSEKYPAKSHASRVDKYFRALMPEKFTEDVESPLFLLAAATTKYWPFCDQTQPFRQNRNFFYLTGCDLSDCFVTYNTFSGELILYLPPVDEESIMWSGLPMSIEEAREAFDVDDVRRTDTLSADLKNLHSKKPIFMVEDLTKGEHAVFFNELKENVNSILETNHNLLEALEEARAIKDDYELSLMKRASEISDNSHLKVMTTMKIHTMENHLHAEFVYHAFRAGSKNQAYDPICCSGRSCSTLHYVRNDDKLANKQLILLDAGAEWKNYASDVTRTFPINGEWTKEAREIYDLVLKMQTECEKRVAPGVSWDELHCLAHIILIKGFLELGVFKNGSVDEILSTRVSVAFMPHGLGHMLGMDTHDTAGKANYDDPDMLYRYLRIRRTLQARNVVTVEPGIYFSHFLIDPFLRGDNGYNGGKYIDIDVLEKYWDVGGVRIEDDVLVTETGSENFTKITKDPDEISRLIKAALS